MLKEGMIKLHYINPNKLSLKYSTKKLKTKIYGFDKYSVLTLKNLNSPEGDTSYRNLLKIPKVSILSFTFLLEFFTFHLKIFLRITYQLWLLNLVVQSSLRIQWSPPTEKTNMLHPFLAELLLNLQSLIPARLMLLIVDIFKYFQFLDL